MRAAAASSAAEVRAGPSGLTRREAAAQLALDGPNELPSAQPRTLLAIAIDVVREPMLFLLVATGIVYLLLGDLEEAVAILGAIGIVIGISLYQAQKTEHALEALRDLSSPRALVVRDGVAMRIPGRDVVRGDQLLLHEGDRVPADAAVAAATNLAVDESLLTGESIPVDKSEHASVVYSGTLIVRGTGLARVQATGVQTELGKIGTTLSRLDAGRTSLQNDVDKVVRVVATAGVAVCVVTAVAYGLHQHRWLDGILAGLTVAISMVPEEFPVVLTVFLALGAWRISRNRVLTRRVPAIEALGAATVLCVDKTGTLTMNHMTVSAIAVDTEVIGVEPGRATLPPSHLSVMETAILASRPDPFDPMERAFVDLGERCGIAVPRRDWTLVHQYPLSDRLLAVTHVWKAPGTVGYIVATKGAPEVIARLCTLDERRTEFVLRQVSLLAAGGLRVLAVARSRYLPSAVPDSPDSFAFTLCGLVGLQDPVRPGVAEAIEECRSAGVRVVMITGDHAQTAVSIARQIGLAHPGSVVTGRDISAMGDEELARRIADVNVFARVVPEQKLRLVTALRARGEVVAMTGDGVNDAPALKAADIGVAMGARGTDVAREAAALVLVDDDFGSIVRAIRLGRRIYDNISKAMSYVLAVHVPIAGMSMIPVLFGGPLVLMPLHIVLMELIIDPACSVAFEMEPAEPRLMQRPPRDPRRRLFTPRFVVRSILQGTGAMLASLVVYFVTLRLGYGTLDVRALTFSTLIVANVALIFTNRSFTRSVFVEWRTPNLAMWMLGAGAVGVLGAVLFIPPLRDLFKLAMPHLDDLSLVAIAGLGALLWMEVVKRAAAFEGGRSAR